MAGGVTRHDAALPRIGGLQGIGALAALPAAFSGRSS